MSTFFCMECGENIGDNLYCPSCGAHRLGDAAMTEQEAKAVLAKFVPKRSKRERQPIFSEEEAFLYGINPDDEMYRKTMELDILSKNYNA